jgi:hypothetical protein
VSKWDTLAVLNDELLQAELAVAAAEIERLQAELNATHNRLASEATRQETDWIASGRAEQLRLNILQLKASQETDRIMLEDLQLNVKIAKDLLVKDAVTPYDLQKAHAAYNALAKKIEDSQLLLTEYQQYLLEAEQRRDDGVNPPSLQLRWPWNHWAKQ